MWQPHVDDCGVEPRMLQQWYNRCNKDLRIYVTQPLYHDPDAAEAPTSEPRQGLPHPRRAGAQPG